MKKISTFLILSLMLGFYSCSSDDNTPAEIEDFTNVEYIKKIMNGTWDAIEIGLNGNWVEIDEDMNYKFNMNGDYSFNWVRGPEVIADQRGKYEITPATSVYYALIDFYIGGDKIPMYLILKDYDKGIVEVTLVILTSSYDFKFKKR